MRKTICDLLPLEYPIVQAGMVWVSSGKLAAASANAGILGVVGAGSMKPDLLEHHILKAKSLTNHPERLAVNVPLLYEKTKEQLEVALKHGIKTIISSAGSPKTYTSWLKDQGCTVIHVTSSPELALKCELAGCDAVIAEGFEAGGHNGREEITTLALIPQVVDAVKIPVIAAGGIGDGRAIAAVMCLGAAGAQLGTRFVATVESSAHDNFKNAIISSNSASTMLMMKKSVPVRLFKNRFFEEIKKLEDAGASKEELEAHLGHGRAKKGMLEGDMNDGEIEVGQISGLIKDVPTVAQLVERLIEEQRRALPSNGRFF
ncbi:NAD(P)H-dependent flavin oxidoreductase [Peredibacter starrii]|uniref:Nitronate monooxygenase n=1 Tax=Peredibacter starrii TaxID=28202 RepID=A0AAX4HJM8_9BACT|nr:nitronate monooxygenase [Peredibacter starrii]WPU63442.1 nitronate monooxygenase [Peredibacter starrii]